MVDEQLLPITNKRVLVTGHTGFKGSWLTLWLHSLRAHVAGYALSPETQPNNYTAAQIKPLLAAETLADIGDVASLENAVADFQPEVIFHLAAQPLVRKSYHIPRETFETNVMGTVNLLEVVRRQNRPCVVVVVTSDKCYENRSQVWGYHEDDAMGGYDPYSASKGASELVVNAFRQSYFSPKNIEQHQVYLASARAGNVIGGGDWSEDRLVTDIVRHLLEKRPIELRNPHAVRPWQYVLEPLFGYLRLAAGMLSGNSQLCGGWNFGPQTSEAITVREVVESFIHSWGSGEWRDVSTPGQWHEADILRLSIDKAVHQLKWNPQWTAYEAITRTANWFRGYTNDPSTARQLCQSDLEDFLSSVRSGQGVLDQTEKRIKARHAA